jgi:hypothetical protein
MLRHNYLRDLPYKSHSRYQKNTQQSENQVLSRRLTRTLHKVYATLNILQGLTPTHTIEPSEITQLMYILDYIDRILINHTTVELIRPPLYFPAHQLVLIRR